MTLDELLQARLEAWPRLTNAKTIAHYARSVRFYGDYLGRPATLADLNPQTITEWAEACVEREGIRPATANSRVKQIRALWDWAARERLPDLKFPPRQLGLREEAPTPEQWEDDHLVVLFAAAEKLTGSVGPHWAADYWRAWLWWSWNTGERTDATLGLTPEMVDWDAGRVAVPGSVRKGGRVPMRYYLSPHAVTALRVLDERTRAGERLFETRGQSDDKLIYKTWRQLLDHAGIEYRPRRTTPSQRMRQTVARRIESRGGTPRCWLGHSDHQVTRRHYSGHQGVIDDEHARGVWPLDTVGTPPVPLLRRLVGLAG